MKQLIGMKVLSAVMVGFALPLVSFGVEVKSASIAVTLDETAGGRVTRLVSAKGVDFALGQKTASALFSVLVRRTDDPAKCVATEASAAKDLRVEPLADGVRLVYAGFPVDRHLERVVCTVRAPKGDRRLRWRLKAVPVAGWALAEAQFPRVSLASRIGAASADDRFVSGNSGSSGVIRAPGDATLPKWADWYRNARQPGYLAVPLMLYYDPTALFYTACEDGRGEVKSLTAHKIAKTGGIFFFWKRHFWAEGESEQPYDVTMAALDAKPNDPLTWEDGCDLYREWSDRQSWSRAKFVDRKDIPDFLRGRVAYLDIGSRWRGLYAPDGKALEKWAKDCWSARFPGTKGILHFDAWERNGTYIMTDYFPLHPTNEAFRRHADAMCANNIYVNPWPSGFRRAPCYDRRDDGTFACDERADFERTFRPHACTMPDGRLFRRDVSFSWLRGGWFHQMCGGDPWTLDWFAEDITGRLADLGVHGISCDQNIGGGFPECWSCAHGHTPGEGYWKTVAARETAIKSYAALKKRHADAFFCFEEPNELVNDVVQLNNSRQAWGAKPIHGWCSPFDYIYHESAPIFGLGGYGLVGYAHGIANGFMPRCGVRRGDVHLGENLFPNADFEEVEENGAKFVGWDRGSVPNGPDFEVKHGGLASLRVAHPGGTNRWDHVARNLDCEDGTFVPGETYRFSAWMKAGKGRIWLDVGVFGGKGTIGWTKLWGPEKPEEGWRLVTSELVYPKGDVNMLRLMFNLKPGSVGWVDDMTVERKLPDGTYRQLRFEGATVKAERERKWIEFYAGPAHDWLAYGRRVKAPRVECATVDYPGIPRPAVFCGAFVSPDGRRAVVFANATDEEQKFTWTGPDGVRHEDSLAGADMKLVEW